MGRSGTFTEPRLRAAIVDRLPFNGTITETGTQSYRLARRRPDRGILCRNERLSPPCPRARKRPPCRYGKPAGRALNAAQASDRVGTVGSQRPDYYPTLKPTWPISVK